jgi:hypothetical protein
VLESLEPLEGSCDCPDFLRSSLGLCKHLLVVLDDLYSNKRRLAAASSEAPQRGRRPELVWDPRLSLTGASDRLLGLELREPENGTRRSARVEHVRRLFKSGRLDPRKLENHSARRDALAALDSAVRNAIDASPAARALVAEELERARRRADNEAAARDAPRHIRTLKRKLYPYQVEGLTRFLDVGRLLLADDMGLGKTTQAIAAGHVLFESRRVRRGILVVPAALKTQWLREWEETSAVPCAVVDGTPNEREAQYRALRSGFLILGYEQLLRDVATRVARDITPSMPVSSSAKSR